MENSYEKRIINLIHGELMVNDATINEQGLKTLFELVFNHNNKRIYVFIVKVRAILTVVNIINKWKDHDNHEKVQIIGSAFMVRFLNEIATYNCFDPLFTNNYYFDILFNLMKSHLTCSSLQENALLQENCLLQFIYFARNWKEFHEYFAINNSYQQYVLFNIAAQFPDNLVIQYLILKCIYQIKTTKFESFNTECSLNRDEIIIIIGKGLKQFRNDKCYDLKTGKYYNYARQSVETLELFLYE